MKNFDIQLVIHDKPKPYLIDQDIDDEMPLFHYYLEQLFSFICGEVVLIFDIETKVNLDLEYDFSVCLDNIIESIEAAENQIAGKKEIWFCEQGSDFYIYYDICGEDIEISFKKGKEAGLPNALVHDFSYIITRKTYIDKWINVFEKIILLFEKKIGLANISIPFDRLSRGTAFK